jgi:hypothetical protein
MESHFGRIFIRSINLASDFGFRKLSLSCGLVIERKIITRLPQRSQRNVTMVETARFDSVHVDIWTAALKGTRFGKFISAPNLEFDLVQ